MLEKFRVLPVRVAQPSVLAETLAWAVSELSKGAAGRSFPVQTPPAPF